MASKNCGTCVRGSKPRSLEPKCQKCFETALVKDADQFSEWEEDPNARI